MSVTGEGGGGGGQGREEIAGAAFGHTLHMQVDDTQENRAASPGLLEGELPIKITFSFSNQ